VEDTEEGKQTEQRQYGANEEKDSRDRGREEEEGAKEAEKADARRHLCGTAHAGPVLNGLAVNLFLDPERREETCVRYSFALIRVRRAADPTVVQPAAVSATV
jgi:hypothetical protein